MNIRLRDAPKWPWPTVFVIEAKGDSAAVAKVAALGADQQSMEQDHMLQALMADRFKMKTHWETKQGYVYNLGLAKGGPKLGTEGSMPPSAQDENLWGSSDAAASPEKRPWGARVAGERLPDEFFWSIY